MLARRFLGCIFVLALLAVAAGFVLYQYGGQALVKMSTPQGHFKAPPASDGPDYADPRNWLARPDAATDASRWRPKDNDGQTVAALPAPATRAATFFVHPTTYLQTDRWNAPALTTGQTEERSQLFVRSQASAFGDVSDVWAPRYRQAAFGAFLLDNADATRALDLAYGDVLRAFDAFLKAQDPAIPLILAGHSQGALHLLRLLGERRNALKGRLVAAYVVGWPVSVTADLPATGLKACAAPADTACVLSWQSFGEPANMSLVLDAWEGTRGPTGIDRERKDIVCVNPIDGRRNSAAPASANLGTLRPDSGFSDATLEPGRVGGRCDRNFLIVEGNLPPLGPFALPGNNLHPFDYALFWGSIRADAARRLSALRPR